MSTHLYYNLVSEVEFFGNKAQTLPGGQAEVVSLADLTLSCDVVAEES